MDKEGILGGVELYFCRAVLLRVLIAHQLLGKDVLQALAQVGAQGRQEANQVEVELVC